MDRALRALGFNRSCVAMLSYLIDNPGPHSTSDITHETGVTQPGVTHCANKLQHFLITGTEPRKDERGGKPRKTYMLRPLEEVREMLFFKIDLARKELDRHQKVISEAL